MRLIVMGQQAFGKDVLAKLLDAGTDEVVAVYCEPDKDGKPVDPIKAFAQEQSLPVHQPATFDDQSTLDTLASHNAELMVMAFVNVFVPEAARDTPTHGSICFHPSLLPKYRGPSAVNWPIIMGDTVSGFSWFYPSDGLDEGDCLMQWECEIGPDDTVIDLYFKKIYQPAVDSVLDVVDHYRTGTPPRIVADASPASTPSSSVSSLPCVTTAMVETNTSRAAKLVSTPTLSCQSYPSGANTGWMVRPSRPA